MLPWPKPLAPFIKFLQGEKHQLALKLAHIFLGAEWFGLRLNIPSNILHYVKPRTRRILDYDFGKCIVIRATSLLLLCFWFFLLFFDNDDDNYSRWWCYWRFWLANNGRNNVVKILWCWKRNSLIKFHRRSIENWLLLSVSCVAWLEISTWYVNATQTQSFYFASRHMYQYLYCTIYNHYIYSRIVNWLDIVENRQKSKQFRKLSI